jgi:hypothetical protein
MRSRTMPCLHYWCENPFPACRAGDIVAISRHLLEKFDEGGIFREKEWMPIQAIPNHCFTFSLNRYHRMISGMMRPTMVLNSPPAVCPATHQL